VYLGHEVHALCSYLLLLAVGCAMGPDLEPAPGVNRVTGLENAAVLLCTRARRSPAASETLNRSVLSGSIIPWQFEFALRLEPYTYNPWPVAERTQPPCCIKAYVRGLRT
jgi:hypothetical protein